MTIPTEIPDGHVTTPWWRRVTAIISLTSLVVIMGFVVAALLGMATVALLLVVDAAVG